MISPLSERESPPTLPPDPPPAYFHQAIAESGSAISSWAFDSTPEQHAKEIGGLMGCPTDTVTGFKDCLKNQKSKEDIVLAHVKYFVSIHLSDSPTSCPSPQTAERAEARMGFGGSVPCAQTHGLERFLEHHPKDYLMASIANPPANPKSAIFGANKHEGSFVLGSKILA